MNETNTPSGQNLPHTPTTIGDLRDFMQANPEKDLLIPPHLRASALRLASSLAHFGSTEGSLGTPEASLSVAPNGNVVTSQLLSTLVRQSQPHLRVSDSGTTLLIEVQLPQGPYGAPRPVPVMAVKLEDIETCLLERRYRGVAGLYLEFRTEPGQTTLHHYSLRLPAARVLDQRFSVEMDPTMGLWRAEMREPEGVVAPPVIGYGLSPEQAVAQAVQCVKNLLDR